MRPSTAHRREAASRSEPSLARFALALATDEERGRLWPRFVEFYPGYDLFERISHGRRIPIVILEPR